MSESAWDDVDRYVVDRLLSGRPLHDAAEAALAASAAAGLPAINVSPPQGMFLHLLVRAQQARSILEIGTLGGYSAIWLAGALPPDGRLVTLEFEPRHAEVATANLARAGLADRASVLLGPATETLERLVDEGAGPFDLVFIDADKPGYPDYLQWSMRLCRPGSVIVADNVVRNGAVVDGGSADANVQGVRRFLELLAAEPRLTATAVQTVGSKGYDGFAMAVVT